jgi:hypothetical protein
MQERNYANRTGSWGPPAMAYVDRDGTIIRAIDPAKYAAWSQGDVAHPNTKLPTIAAAVASGVNMNEWVTLIASPCALSRAAPTMASAPDGLSPVVLSPPGYVRTRPDL